MPIFCSTVKVTEDQSYCLSSCSGQIPTQMNIHEMLINGQCFYQGTLGMLPLRKRLRLPHLMQSLKDSQSHLDMYIHVQ